MKLKIALLSIILPLLFSGKVFSSSVEDVVARKVATNWYRHYAPASKQLGTITKVKEYKWGNRTSFYICSFDKGGFVLVSANDQVSPVLGYGVEHGVPDEITNEAVKGWFDNYARQIDTAFMLNLKSDEASVKWSEVLNNNFPKTQRSIVEPLLTTTWDQGWPYNAMCPTNPSGSGGHCYTGCVATAYGQILKYYNYPEKGSNEISYTDINGHQISANFGSTYYNWDEMPTSLPNSDTAYTATAELLFHCGVAALSNYNLSATAGYYVEEPLLNIFDYAYSNLIWVQRASTLPNDWDNILINELNSERPIYYTGSGPDGGHAFVCDGYDGADYFHFNVGWGGQANGYYLTSALNFSGLTFNDSQRVLIGIEPNDGSNVANDTILSGYNHFNSSMYVNATSTVTIMPGSTLVFDSACFFKIGGNFMSKGTDESPIDITAFDTVNRWGGLKIHRDFFYLINGIETDTLLVENSNISFSENNGIYYNGGETNIADDSTISKGLFLIKAHVFKNTGFGINTEFCKVYIDSCTIENNGGGFKLNIGWSEVKNSSFQYNTNYGVYIQNQLNFCKQPSFVSNCNISHNLNTETQLTGGIYFAPGSYFAPEPVGSKSLIQQNTISYNTGNPGGMRVHGYVDISRNNIFHNVSSFYGGGVMIADGAKLVNNEIYNNSANNGGGGVSVSYGTIVNNLIYNNNSGIAGTALVDASILNNTIANNGNGISFVGFGSMEIKNNILWNSGVEIDVGDNQVSVSRSIVRGGIDNIYATTSLSTIENIIKRDPEFKNPSDFIGIDSLPEGINWGLQLISPAIDASIDDTSGLCLPQSDVYGYQRINRTLDIGAVENQSDTIFPCFIEDGYTINSCSGNSVFITIPFRGIDCQIQWYFNDSINLGINNDTLSFDLLSDSDSGSYICVISNTYGSDTSDYIKVNVFSSPPSNPVAIYGIDTIHHFENEIIYWSHKIPNSTELEWIASPGLSFYTINDTLINLKVIDTISTAFIKFYGRNPCGTSIDTAVLNLTVLSMPDMLTILGDSTICAGTVGNWWDNMYTTDFNYQYDRIEWQIPSDISAKIYEDYGYMGIYQVDSLASSDTLYARWVKNNYGIGQWSSFPLAIQGMPTANAGTDTTIYENVTYNLAAEATNYETIIWSSDGDGTFDDVNLLAASYTPGSNDISLGSANLIITASAIDSCGTNANDSLTLTIQTSSITPELNINEVSNINIYPNPTTGHFNIDFIGEATTAEIMLLTLQGIKFLETKCKDQFKQEIDIGHLPMGMYLIIIKTQEKIIIKKIIKKY